MKNDEISSGSAVRRYEIGDFRVDGRQGRLLRRDGTPVQASPRVVEALVYFAERPGEILDKSTLMRALWPAAVVEENNLNQLILMLRRALGDDPQESRYVQTVPRRGFRFVAEVRAWAAEPVSSAATPGAAPVSTTDVASVAAGPGVAPAVPAASTEPPAAVPPSSSPPESSTSGPAQPRFATRWRRPGITAVALVALALAAGFAWRATRHAEVPPPAPSPAPPAATTVTTLAVLPFKSVVPDNRDEAVEAGMADSLIARLSTLPGVSVRAFSSVRRYGGPDQDPLAAARELEVEWVVDGTVQRAGDQIRVTARLLRASNGLARWSGSFDERYKGVFDLQDTIADRVAQVIAPRLDASARARMPGSGTRDVEAYQFYLAAHAAAQDMQPVGLRRSVELYNRAIQRDPGYALAYAGLADTYRRLPFGQDTPPTEAFEPARAAALRAIALDPSLAEGHAALGWVRFWYDFDWPGAEAAFRRALELNPNVPEAHLGLGHMLAATGRYDEGFLHVQRSRELDPMSPIANTLEAGYLLARGRRAEADQRIGLALELNPQFWVGHLTMSGFHMADGRPDLAIESLRRADLYSGGESTQALSLLGEQLARQGQRAEAEEILARMLAASRTRYVPPTSIAAVYAGLGRKREALDWLDKAWDVRDLRLAFMRVDDRWSGLQGEERFRALLHKLRLDTLPKGKAAH